MDEIAPSFLDHWPMKDRFRSLPEAFYAAPAGDEVGSDPILIHASPPALAIAGLSEEATGHPDFVPIFSGQREVPGFSPYATVYAGHQFGHYVPQLGDGRAYVIAQGEGPDGNPWEVQLKGAGRTPFSRFGDGRAVMRSVLREYLCSEHMAALGVPTTRAGTVIATRERVERETIEPGAVMSRIAPSHLRFGHFEYFAHTNQTDLLKALMDYTLSTLFPHIERGEGEVATLFNEVVESTADLMAHWQAVGFAHGVMNTDNMSILGLTIDYGPFGFLDQYKPNFICNHSDHHGRYAFEKQPAIALWNLQALASALLPLTEEEPLREGLSRFAPRFKSVHFEKMQAKLGFNTSQQGDDELVASLLSAMEEGQADYTQTFRGLGSIADGEISDHWLAGFAAPAQPAIRQWLDAYRARLLEEAPNERAPVMAQVNPKYVLRNWVAETAIRALEDEGDLKTLDEVFRLVTAPFDDHPGQDAFAEPPPETMQGLSVSCSS